MNYRVKAINEILVTGWSYKIKITSDENETKWLNITDAELTAIRIILSKETEI
jgi:hypothetical protein